MVLGIDDEHVAGGIDRHLLRRVEHRVARIVAIARVAARAGAGDGFDDAVANAAQAAALPLHDVERVIRRQRDRTGAEDIG